MILAQDNGGKFVDSRDILYRHEWTIVENKTNTSMGNLFAGLLGK